MTINRRTMTVGLAALALVGLTSGGIAWAATDAGDLVAPGSSSSHCAGQGWGYGDFSPMSTAADYLGLTQAELLDRVHSGESLADVAREEGRTVAGLKEAMVSAMERALASDSDLTPARRTALLAVMESHLDAMITGTHPDGMDWDDMRDMMGGGSGMMGGSGGGMMGGRGDGWRGFGSAMMG